MMCICNEEAIVVEDVFHAERVLGVKLRRVDDGFLWALANVYGPNVQSEKDESLDLLSNVKAQWSIPWVSGGDFNKVRFPYEKNHGSSMSRSMELFFDFINANELLDFPLLGRRFTWSNNRIRPSMSIIDRFLFSNEWEEHFNGVIQVALPRLISDHCPIKLCSNSIDCGPRPFHSQNC